MPIVYRYLPAHAAISTLKSGMLWLARPECFNDVFELRPHFQSLEQFQLPIPKDATEEVRAIIAEKQAELDKQLLRPAIKDTLIAGHTKTIVVLSLAETCDSLRMWAHYADAHRGVALGFDTDTHSWSCQHLDVWILVPASRGDPPRCAPVQGGELILGSRELH